MSLYKELHSADETMAFAGDMAKEIKSPSIVYLIGELGAGKTTFVRGFLRAFGYTGRVKSPSYTIVEHYQIDEQSVYHVDLYRLQSENELEFLGFRDYLAEDAIFFIEWPENAASLLPAADVTITIEFFQQGRRIKIT